MPYWNGVTRAELSFDDARQWQTVFPLMCPGGSLRVGDLTSVLAARGFGIAPDDARRTLVQSCCKLFNIEEAQAESRDLDEASGYRLVRHVWLSARHCAEYLRADRPKRFFKMYWNQLRMGGRDPEEIPRPVVLEDALSALGLKADRIDHSAAEFLRQVEQDHGVRLPTALMNLLRCDGVARAVVECHPNDNNLVGFRRERWRIRRGMRDHGLAGDCAIIFMEPHQADNDWAVVFDDGEDDARVYVRWESDTEMSWFLTAPSVAMFFWDLAQTGLAWYQDTGFRGGKSVRRSDIGLVLDESSP